MSERIIFEIFLSLKLYYDIGCNAVLVGWICRTRKKFMFFDFLFLFLYIFRIERNFNMLFMLSAPNS